MNEALDALQSQLANDADAAAAFKSWRERRVPLANADMQSKEIRLAAMGRQP